MYVNPVTSRCSEIFDRRAHAVVGISPFNSYFSEARIFELVHWAYQTFTAFHLYVPDGPAAFTLEALGYPRDRAKKKARRQANYLNNKLARALRRLGIGDKRSDRVVLNSHALDKHTDYAAFHRKCETLFARDPGFRDGCLESAAWVLEKHPDLKGPLIGAAIEGGARYFLAELPFFLDTPSILGVPESVFCYQQCPPFLRTLLDARRGEIVSTHQGFVEIVSRPTSEGCNVADRPESCTDVLRPSTTMNELAAGIEQPRSKIAFRLIHARC